MLSRCKRGRGLGAREAAHSGFQEDGLALLGGGGGGHRGLSRAAAASEWGGDPLLLERLVGRAAQLLAGPALKYGCGEAMEEWARLRWAPFLQLFKL